MIRAKPAFRLACSLLAVALAACAGKPKKPPAPEPAQPPSTQPHPDLYAPHIADGAPEVPPDIAALAEPVPVAEPRARYGNHSPYTVLGRSYRVMDRAEGYVERGIASWYGTKFHGRPTSSLEPYDMYKFTAAHTTLPLPSYVRVTHLDNGRSVVVRVNDRGPFHDGRIIDLSYAAAVKLGMHEVGTARVEVRALRPGAAGTEPGATAAVADSGRRWLQVGSFAERDNARRMERRLRESGFHDLREVRALVAGAQVWRVQVGPLADAGALARAERRLRELGFGVPQILRE